MQPIEPFTSDRRRPEWVLTPEDYAGILLPSAREELDDVPTGSRRLLIHEDFRDGHAWVRIICLDRDLETVFLRFCESVLAEIARNAPTPLAIGRALSRFRRLFEQADSAIDGERIAGLVAELFVLEWLVENGTNAVRAWRGPYGETHDFAFGNLHVEVKALPASGERKCRISNIHQLEEPMGGTLFLAGVRLAPGRETIGTILERLLTLLPHESVDDLEAAIQSAGCPVPITEPWNRRGFALAPVEVWRIDAGFPRLVPGSLQAGSLQQGVTDVRYTVSLEVAGASVVDPRQLISVIGETGGELS
ncbi:PD-(D/E)XK motif protein [Ruegeria sp. HKCCD4884]|nr:PD-(D/E)XK motif protein [Ruegeria sp. HKCCD4884]